MKRLSKKQLVWGAGIIAVVLIIFVALVVGGNGNGHERVVVERRDLVDEVNIAGTVEANTVSDLGFEVSGRANSVIVAEGDEVFSGQTLVTLDLGTFPAELAAAEADVLIKLAELENSQANLNVVIVQQDTAVENAYRTLLSDDLEAYPSIEQVTATAPTITGRYTGPEGQYKIRVVRGASNNDYELRVFGIEKVLDVDVDDTTAAPLGTYGLFISFPDGVAEYEDTTWYLDIPNVDSSSYTENLNAYQDALVDRAVAIEEAQAELSGTTGVSVAEAELARAQAEVSRIQAEINKRVLSAPLSSVVTQVEVDPGEIVAANEAVVSLISTDGFGIEVDIPEIDSVKVKVGDPAVVTLDAFGDDVLFNATVVSVNRTETIVDNVAVYEARLVFDEEDARIASGMTADVTITTDTEDDVLAVPVRALQFRDDGTPFVFVEKDGEEHESDISLGLRGSDGFVEVQAGVAEGDTVLIPKV